MSIWGYSLHGHVFLMTDAGTMCSRSLPRMNVTPFSHMSRDVRKPVFGLADQVRHKPACSDRQKSAFLAKRLIS